MTPENSFGVYLFLLVQLNVIAITISNLRYNNKNKLAATPNTGTSYLNVSLNIIIDKGPQRGKVYVYLQWVVCLRAPIKDYHIFEIQPPHALYQSRDKLHASILFWLTFTKPTTHNQDKLI